MTSLTKDLLCFVILTLVSCSCEEKTILLTQAEKDKAVRVAKGDSIVVKLPVTPATGYMWRIRDISGVLKQVGSSQFETLEPGAGKPGATEVQAFRFSAQERGNERLRFTYGRQAESLREITFAITVQ